MSQNFEATLLKEVKDNVLHKYSNFVEQFNDVVDSIHQKNVIHINSSIAVSNNPLISDDLTERTDLFELLQTCGNMTLNKLMLVFATICQEMNKLDRLCTNEFINPLVLYGDCKSNVSYKNENDGDELHAMSKFLPILFDLLCYINRCFALAKNLVEQLVALFDNLSKTKTSSPSRPFIEVSGVRFNSVFDSLSCLSVTVINIDEVLRNNDILRKDFVNYKRIIELVVSDSQKFDVNDADAIKVKALLTLIVKIEKDVIDGESVFKRLIDTLAADEKTMKNSSLCEQFASYINEAITDYEGESTSRSDRRWLEINALFILYVWAFRKDDKKLLRTLIESEKKTGICLVHLKGNCTVLPDKLLTTYLPKSMIDKKLIETVHHQREFMLKLNLDKEVKQINVRVTHWLVQYNKMIDESQDNTNNLIETLKKQNRVIEDGIELAVMSSQVIKNCITLHLQFNKVMTRSDLVSVCKLVNILKCIQLQFNGKKGTVLLIISRWTQYNSCVALNALSLVKKRLLSEVKKYSEKKLDLLSALILASNCIHGPILTESRQLLMSLCLDMVQQTMNETERVKVRTSVNYLVQCSNIFPNINEQTNCDFMYFSRSVFGVYFHYFYENEATNIHEIRYFLHSLSDCLPLIECYPDETSVTSLKKTFEEEVWNQFKIQFLDNLCADFETELRLQIHSHLQLEDQSPFKRKLHNFSAILTAEPICFLNKFIFFKNIVEDYLNEMAYNLTTIALHDWKTYESMLNLAKNKYGLEFITSQLPTQTIEQGLDVLEITRNIHVFVARYLYNLNNQMFIERSSENKHLNVLLIRHVSNSIQTHGFGIINTAVNFTYNFLKKKFSIFSQFLYEDRIKSRLMKDLKHFREMQSNKFPFEKAEKLVKGIRKLGLTPDGLSYLDQFRQLISQIGNALGFVRMLRSGALHCSSNSINYVPDLDDLADVNFEIMVKEDGLATECIDAAKNLDSILLTLNRNFSEATDYFKLLVEVFAGKFRDSKHYHMKNFYVILPALTLNYVESSIISKEKMTRKNKVGAAFTDDGFAMGVAYILNVLNQYYEFDSLHWFASIKDKVLIEKNEAIKNRNSSQSGDEKLSQTTSLTLRRLEVLEKEFDLLNYSLTGSRILFKASSDAQVN